VQELWNENVWSQELSYIRMRYEILTAVHITTVVSIVVAMRSFAYRQAYELRETCILFLKRMSNECSAALKMEEGNFS
jgi:hypothetical protein